MVNISKMSAGGGDDDGPIKPIEDIIFTVDPDIYEKVGVRKPKKGEELNGMEAEKLYRYQLEQDEQKIIDKYGSYKSKTDTFHERRMEEVTYATFNTIKPLGHVGRFNESARAAREISWRATSKVNTEVYGTHLKKAPVIAGKRYKEWLTGKPAGPSQEFLVDKEQRRVDQELWENIRFARLEKTRTELREESKARSIARNKARKEEKENAKKKGNEEADENASAVKLWKAAIIAENEFERLRMMPTKQQQYNGMKGWDYGHQGNYDVMGTGFPKINQPAFAMEVGERMSEAMVRGEELAVWERTSFDRGGYIKEQDEMEREYIDYTVDTNMKKAKLYLVNYRRKMKKEERERKKKAEIEAYNRKRVGILSETDMQLDAVMAKTAVMMNSGAFAVKGANVVEEIPLDEIGLTQEEVEEKRAKEKRKAEEEKADLEDVEQADNLLHLLKPIPAVEEDERWDEFVDIIDWSSMNVLERKRMEIELSNPFSVTNMYTRLERARRNFSANNIRVASVKSTRVLKSKGRFWYYQLHPQTIKRRWHYYSNCKCFKGERIYVDDDDAKEEGAEKKKQKREWMKYTDEEIAAMDSKDRKRLKSMKERDLDADKAQAKEDASAQSRAAAFAKKKEEEAERMANRNPFMRLYRMVFKAKKNSMSDLDKRRREAKQKAEKLLKEEADQERAMEMLFSFREKQRMAVEAYKAVLTSITGKEFGAAADEFNADELVRYARMGDYTQVIDILDHGYSPVGPNEPNSDGISAFYMVLEMTLNNQAADSGESLFNDRTCWQAIMAKLRNSAAAGKLDLTLRALAHKGGDVNYIKDDRDSDGEAILHLAAAAGSSTMIEFLARKGADFDVRTSELRRTPLMCAAKAGKVDATMTLLENGSMRHMDAVDTHGWTALHHAAANGTPELVTVLLMCGANAYQRNDRGLIPLDEAMAVGRMNVVEAIRCYKVPDLAFRLQLEFMNIHYLDGEREVVAEAEADEGGEEGVVEIVEEQKAE
jgi:hypothetical protein